MILMTIETQVNTYHKSAKDKEEVNSIIKRLNETGEMEFNYLEENIPIEEINIIKIKNWDEVI